jgi:hypothetical protein
MTIVTVLAAFGSAVSVVLTSVATANPTAIHAMPLGLGVALAHVPVWSHAHTVLASRAALYAQNGGAGAAAGGAAGFGAKKLGFGKVLNR